ncbi:MAG TPA: hypothetical protein VMF67_04085 [Rhizomicrobium sp.]|nr:hypothetical protein [Rhizomicrobium sp.]
MRGRPGTGRSSKRAKKSTRSKTARTRTGRTAAKKAKVPAKKPAKKKAVRKTAAPARKKSTARKSPAAKTSAKRTAKRAPRGARKETFGEGNYTATREIRDQETGFVRRNKNRITSIGEDVAAALEGHEGEEPKEAGEEAHSHSHSPDDEG